MYNPQLETFIRVADAGSFNKAAEELYITAPAVIKQINLLEAELNLRLFERTHCGLTLTEAGKSLYKDAKYVIQYCKDSVLRAKKAMQSQDCNIRIGTSPMTPGQFLVALWPKIHERCPDIRFRLIPYENTPQNAVEILRNLGQNIDVVAGVYDGPFLKSRKCAALELSREPVCCALSIHHPLAEKEFLTVEDLFGENLMLMRRGWNSYVDALRDDILHHYPEIHLVDFDFYSTEIFNQCENEGNLLMSMQYWKDVHPLLKVLPVRWDYTLPFGLLHSPSPTWQVRQFLDTVRAIIQE